MSVYKSKNRYLIVARICAGDIREVGVEMGVADCLSYSAGGSNVPLCEGELDPARSS